MWSQKAKGKVLNFLIRRARIKRKEKGQMLKNVKGHDPFLMLKWIKANFLAMTGPALNLCFEKIGKRRKRNKVGFL